jgi:hypothetical protein
MGRAVSVIEWLDSDGGAVVEERREVRGWALSPTRRVVDFSFVLRAVDGPVVLGGDPHHAGFQFRSREGRSEREPLRVVYERSNGARALGNDIWADCNWVAGHFDLDGEQYTIVHMDAPTNPRPIRYSTRPYGRFGSFFEGELGDEPLALRYRILFERSAGQVSQQELEGLYLDFVEPLRVEVQAR